MPNQQLNQLLRQVTPQIGWDHARTYVYPLLAFLSLEKNKESIRAIIDRGLTPQALRGELDSILAADAFLAKCCGDAQQLAKALDILFFRNLSPSAYPDGIVGLGLGGDPIESALVELDRKVYQQGEFKKSAYFHLFNVAFIGNLLLEAPYQGWQIVQLEPTAVAPLLGETTLFSFLSPPATGTLFLVCEDTDGFDSETMEVWLDRRGKEAVPFRQILQYSIDGVVDIDYVVPKFSPDWVNELHRHGLYYRGSPRQDSVPIALRFYLVDFEQTDINKMWQTYLRHRERITSRGASLRKAIRIAGEFFEEFHKKSSRAEQLANLIIALEALYTPSDQSEQTYRISQSCALMVCDDSSERKKTFEFLRAMFKRRGKLFHGQYDTLTTRPEEFITDEEIRGLLSLVRKSILKFMTLYLRGEDDLERVRKHLHEATLDEAVRAELLQKSDYAELITGGLFPEN